MWSNGLIFLILFAVAKAQFQVCKSSRPLCMKVNTVCEVIEGMFKLRALALVGNPCPDGHRCYYSDEEKRLRYCRITYDGTFFGSIRGCRGVKWCYKDFCISKDDCGYCAEEHDYNAQNILVTECALSGSSFAITNPPSTSKPAVTTTSKPAVTTTSMPAVTTTSVVAVAGNASTEVSDDSQNITSTITVVTTTKELDRAVSKGLSRTKIAYLLYLIADLLIILLVLVVYMRYLKRNKLRLRDLFGKEIPSNREIGLSKSKTNVSSSSSSDLSHRPNITASMESFYQIKGKIKKAKNKGKGTIATLKKNAIGKSSDRSLMTASKSQSESALPRQVTNENDYIVVNG